MFLEKFNELLKANGLNQKQFAEKSKIPYTTVNGWCARNRLPDCNAIIEVAKYFNCSTDYLLGLEDTGKKNNPKININHNGQRIQVELTKEQVEDLQKQLNNKEYNFEYEGLGTKIKHSEKNK